MTEIIDPPVLVPASAAKRLANYIIDFLLYCFVASMLITLLNPFYPLATRIMNRQPIGFSDQLMLNFAYGLYMSVTEALLRGKSVGKLITGTRAVNESGYPISSQTAFLRGLIRLIPFPLEQLSAIPIPFSMPSYPWHDRWSRSHVIDEKKSILPPAQ